jgi:hypothetical protein
VEDTSERNAIVERVLPRLTRLSDRQALLDLVRGAAGPQLVSDETIKVIEQELRQEPIPPPPADLLAKEHATETS